MMTNRYESTLNTLRSAPKKWLVTGVAGFIGSNLLETLLLTGQEVVGLDNFATGHQRNLDEVRRLVTDAWSNFEFIEGDIRDLATCRVACDDVDYVLHQAALGSVPRSINDPISTNSANVDGFLNMLVAARDAQVKSFTYAASSSTYGDHPSLPKVENIIGKPLSPYAVTKYFNELYAEIFAKTYGFKSIGLRYFNVFGKRQDPNGAYAAVIPKWIAGMVDNKSVDINGDGQTTRDFCFVENVVQANLLAATTIPDPMSQIFNVAVGDSTSLNELFQCIREILADNDVPYSKLPRYQEFRVGDIRSSQADITKAIQLLGYSPEYRLRDGMVETIRWHLNKCRGNS